ncbi:O-antigen ligase family protein [Macrococcoides bohemicum]|uniref:O-antigen ligase family protein n=1 Tax=Macrococcoides bohemicum TaxID=1903056 RepID=UPI003B0058E1
MNKQKIYKSDLELFLSIIIFFFSFIDPITLYISMFASLLLLSKGYTGFVKLMILYTLRTVISPGLFFPISEYPFFQYFKWLMIFGVSTLIIAFNIKKNRIFQPLFLLYTVFIIYLVISSYFYSHNINLAISKIINYSLPMFALLLIKEKLDSTKLIYWFSSLMKWTTIISLPLILLPLGYLRNGHAYQGIFDNPNMLGILLVISFATLVSSNHMNFQKYLISVLYLLLIYLSESRTSMMGFIILLIIIMITSRVNIIKKILVFLFSFVVIGLSYFTPIYDKFLLFAFKGQKKSEMLYSREGQLESFRVAFKRSPIFGNGFGVPINLNIHVISKGTIVEAGNIFLALIMYSGIVGLILFLIIVIFWMFKINKYYFIVFLSTILINLGEMVLFSSNSIGLLCSILWVLALKKYILNDVKDFNFI